MTHLRVWLMVALTFVTGMLDAVGYIGLDRVFTGNMTGNIVILGMGVAGQDSLPVLGPLCALGGYVCGAAVVGRLLGDRQRAWTGAVTAVFAANAVVLVVLATVLALADVSGGTGSGVAVAASIAVVMGGQAAAARALAVTDMTTVVVTSTLTAFAGETLFSPGFGWFTHRRFWALVAIFGGALFGALMVGLHVSVPVYLAAVVSAAVAMIGHRAWELAEIPGER